MIGRHKKNQLDSSEKERPQAITKEIYIEIYSTATTFRSSANSKECG
jgi:hypothetical protein